MLDLNYNISGRNRSILIIVTLLGAVFSPFYYLVLYPNSCWNIDFINYSVSALYVLFFILAYLTKEDGKIKTLEQAYLLVTMLVFLYNSLVVFSAEDPSKYQGIPIVLFASLLFSIDRYLYQRIFILTSLISFICCYFVFKVHQPEVLVLFLLFIAMISAYLYFSKNAIAKVSTLSLNFERFINNELSGYVFVDRKKNQIIYSNDRSKAIWLEPDIDFLHNIKVGESAINGTLKFTHIISKKHHSIYRIDDITKEQNSIDFYNHIFEENLAGIYETDITGKIKLANDSFARIFGFDSKEEIIGEDVARFYTNPEQRDKFLQIIKKEKHLTNFEAVQINKNGEEFYVLNNIVFNESKNSLSGIIIDITAKKEHEKKLIEEKEKSERAFDDRELKLKGIFEGLKNTRVYTLNKNKQITSLNQTAKEAYFAIKKEDISVGQNFFESWKHTFSPEYKNQLEKGVEEAFKGKGSYALGKIRQKERDYWIESYINPIYSTEGSINEVSIINNDITEKQEYEKRLKTNLEEKEILLKEVHHRVKNNLQVISSILNLQSSFIEDEAVRTILAESQNRVKTMSFIHESLYQTENFVEIRFTEHIEKLLHNLIYSYAINKKNISVKSDIEDISLNLDVAIPLGLIINEVISNSMKHAFKEKEKGEIHVSMKRVEDKIHLSLDDDGIGISENLNIYESNTLGLQLIITLVDQIDGTITIENKEGTKILIIFAP